MMLDSKTAKKIIDFVYTKPRSIQEIAYHIQRNWRTADSYVDRIIKEQGVLATKVFREGTRGALKIVFWSNIERIHSSDFQEKLFKKIESARHKRDFSPTTFYERRRELAPRSPGENTRAWTPTLCSRQWAIAIRRKRIGSVEVEMLTNNFKFII